MFLNFCLSWLDEHFGPESRITKYARPHMDRMFPLFQGYQGENGDLKNRRGLDVRFNHMDFPMGDMEKNESTYADSSIGEGMDITIQVTNLCSNCKNI